MSEDTITDADFPMQGKPQAVGSINDNPDQAARAVSLGDATNTPPLVVYGDMDSFEQNHKAALASQLIDSNPKLGDYIASDPMAPKVSNDDYGQLAAVSQAASKLTITSPIKAMWEGFKEGYDQPGFDQDMSDLMNLYHSSPIKEALAKTIALPIYGAMDATMRATGGLIQGAAAGAVADYRYFTGADETQGNKLLRDLIVAANVSMGAEGSPLGHAEAARPFVEQGMRDVLQVAGRALPFVVAGEEPPVGAHPLIDQSKVAQADQDLFHLQAAVKESQASATRDRAPDMFRKFAAQHVGEDTVGISADAVQKLYGDKVPAADDGKLGFVPDIANQLLRSTITGTDIQVPIADMMAKMDPAVFKELEDHIRVRPDGVTKEEGKNLPANVYDATAEVAAMHANDPVTTVREAAGLNYNLGTTVPQATMPKLGSYGSQSISATMHAPEIGEALGQDIAGTHVRAFGGPLDETAPEVAGVVAYHGTPHEFDRFSTDKIGIGEGAQAFGHGLYFAERKKLAEHYRDTLSQGGTMSPQFYIRKQIAEKISNDLATERQARGEPHDDRNAAEPEDYVNNMFYDHVEGMKIADQHDLYNIEDDNGNQATDLSKEAYKRMVAAFDHLPSLSEYKATPSLFQVKVNHDVNKFLDYDKPYSEQSQYVKDAIGFFINKDKYADLTGKELYDHINDQTKDPKLTSETLHEIGIPGIKYLDRSSRIAGEGTSNYVVFNDKDITVTHKNDAAVYQMPLDEYLKGEAKSAFLEEMKAAAVSPEDFSPDITLRAEEIIAHGEHIDPGLALEQATIESLPEEDANEVYGEPAQGNGGSLTPTGRGGSGSGGEPPSEGQGVGGSGEAGKTPQLFEDAKSIGMTVDQYKRYMSKIAQRDAEDYAAALKRAQAEQRRIQKPEYLDAKSDMTDQVTLEIAQQPNIMADRILREHGKLDIDALTTEQQAILPKEYATRKNGVDPELLAKSVGYDSADEMVRDLAAMKADRDASGLQPKQYFQKMVSDEVDRRMEVEHGSLDENVIAAARDQVASKTQLDILHAETEDAAQKAGVGPPKNQSDLLAGVKRLVDAMPMKDISSKNFLAASGRAGRAVEMALLKDDFAEAFRQKQRQYLAVAHAKEAIKLEKAKKGFDKIAKRYASESVTGADQAYVDQMHDILRRLGQKLKVSPQFVANQLAKGDHPTLAQFIEAKEGMQGLRDLYVPDFIIDPTFNKPIGDLTGEQFRDLNTSMKAMVFNARDEAKIIRAGEKVDFAATRQEMIDKLQTMGYKKPRIDLPNGERFRTAKSLFWSGFNLETFFDRLDRDNPRGIFNQVFTRQFTQAASYEARMIKEFDRQLSKLSKFTDMEKAVDNKLFIDPNSPTKEPLQMRMRNVYGILQNVGNADNLKALAEGYNLQPEQIMDWLKAKTTKADWDRAQKIGDMFNELHDRADQMSRRVNGVGIDKVETKPFQSPHGDTYPGWYNPIARDKRLGHDVSGSNRPDSLAQQGYFKATPSKAYTKERTGYIAPVQLDMKVVETRMQQMIHDIATRETTVQLSKFFYDKKFQQAMKDYYGPHQEAALIPFLRDFAGSANFRSDAEATQNRFVQAMTSNMVTTSIGLNPNTVLKHGLTAMGKSFINRPLGFTHELLTLLKADPATGDSNWRMAFDKSDELKRRLDNWQEVFAGHAQEVSLRTSDIKGLRRSVKTISQYIGAAPVATFDLLSAVPTFLAEYKRAIAVGEDEGQAIFLGEKAVRQTHGSTLITNKPEITRNKSGLTKTFMQFYGPFSENLQQQYRTAYLLKDAINNVKDGDHSEAMAKVPKIAGLFFGSTILPALIEHAVMSTPEDKKETTAAYVGKLAVLGTTSSLIGVRDLGTAVTSSFDPQGGVIPTVEKSFIDPIRDLLPDKHGKIKAFTPATAGQFMRHFTTMVGMATGMANTQEGKVAQFVWNYAHNREHPQGPWGVMQGMRYGKIGFHTKTFNDWLKEEGVK